MATPHRGEVLKNALKAKSITQTGLAKELGIHRNTLADYFDDPDLPDSLLIQIGRLINYDFSNEIAELKTYRIPPTAQQLDEAQAAYQPSMPKNLPECQIELLRVYKKYASLLEQHVALQARLAPIS